ncbi:MAG: TIGR00266 family protein [Lachnospiraceae bacterium]|nr:TIGR00266 family protein [Lachnospiraceae bacterium]
MKYSIQGDTLPVAICTLDAGESVITESGAMSWMSPNMKMDTKGGGIGKMVGRAFSGESIFQNIYTAQGGEGMIALASSFPGCIKAFEITPGNSIILQKSAFLAGDSGVELSIHFKKKLGAGLFGGEGFIMQKVSGTGTVLAEFDGHVVEYELEAGQQLILDTGYLAAMTEGCSMDIQTVPGIKNMFLGGEGIFNTVVTGPGHVWVQTMPISNVAAAISRYIPTGN